MSAATKVLTEAHRQQQLQIRAYTVNQLTHLWPVLDPRKLDVTYPAWSATVAQLLQQNRAASATLAGQYLNAFRLIEGVQNTPAPVLDLTAPDEQVAVSLLVTSVVAVKISMAAGQNLDAAMQSGFVQSAGAVSRLVLDGARGTIVGSLRSDNQANGWERVVAGNACDFCTMLADRGAVYSADTADFASHDHCACMAEPVYR